MLKLAIDICVAIWNAGFIQLSMIGIAAGLVLEAAHGRHIPGTALMFNLKCMLVNFLSLLVIFPLGAVLLFMMGRLHLGLFHLDIVLHNHALTMVVALFVNLLVWDIFYYWFHRAQHTFRFMWEVHKLHHSDQHFGTSTYSRHHWLEQILQTMLIQCPIAILFNLTPVDYLLNASIFYGWAYFIHTDLPVRFGFMTRMVSGPMQHRIHHSSLLQHRNRNFAFFFPFLDILFETYHEPVSEPYPTGIGNTPSQPTLHEVVWGPFIAWRGMLRRGVRW